MNGLWLYIMLQSLWSLATDLSMHPPFPALLLFVKQNLSAYIAQHQQK